VTKKDLGNSPSKTPPGISGILLSQTGPALFADTLIKIIAQIFFTGRALPVIRRKIDKGKDKQDLQGDKGVLRERPEEIRAFVQYGEQKNEKDCGRDSEDLAGAAHGENPLDRLRVSFFHLRKFLLLEENDLREPPLKCGKNRLIITQRWS
jgi:hypothetical protein